MPINITGKFQPSDGAHGFDLYDWIDMDQNSATGLTSGHVLTATSTTAFAFQAPATSGTVTSVAVSGGTTGLTTSGGPITTSGTITLAGTLAIANGGTGQVSALAAFNALSPLTTAGDLLTHNGTNNIRLADVAAGSYLRSGGVSTAPLWSTLILPNALTSGAILYGSAANTAASSAALAANQLVLGGGAGGAPATLGSLGTTATVLHGNAAGAPTFAAVSLTADVSGDLPFANLAQGSALSVLGVTGNATADNASIAAGSDHQVLRRSGTAVAFGAVNLAQSAAVTGLLALANGGTNANLTAVNGGIFYSTATAGAISAAGSSGQLLRSAGAAAPTWTTATFPVTAGTSGNVLTSDGTNWSSAAPVGGLSVHTHANAGDGGNTLAPSLITIDDTTSSTAGLIKQSGSQLLHTFSPPTAFSNWGYNVFLGYAAGNFAVSDPEEFGGGSGNVGIGYLALTGLTTGLLNLAIGAAALEHLTDGQENTALGALTLRNSESGSQNTAIGYSVGQLITTGSGNLGIGRAALSGATTGSNNVAVGLEASLSLSTADACLAIGAKAGRYSNVSNRLYINTVDRANASGDITGSLIYGELDAVPSAQVIRLNADVIIGYGINIVTAMNVVTGDEEVVIHDGEVIVG